MWLACSRDSIYYFEKKKRGFELLKKFPTNFLHVGHNRPEFFEDILSIETPAVRCAAVG